MSRIRLSVVGYGSMSQRTYCPLLYTLAEDVELASLVEVDEAKREAACRTYSFRQSYADIEEMLHTDPPQAALVLVPAAVHAPVVRTLLAADVDVYTEKPDTYALDEARELVALAQEHGRVYQVGQNRLFMTALVRAREFFNDTPVDFIHVEKSKTVRRTDSEYLLDDGIHVMSPLLWLAGDIAEVLSARCIPQRLLTAHFRLASGGAAVLVQHLDSGFWVERFLLHGQGKSADIMSPDVVELHQDGQQVGNGVVGRCPLLFDTAGLLGFQAALAHFIDCVRSRSEPIGAAARLLRVHEIMNEVFRRAGLPEL